MDDPATIASLHGLLSVILGALCAASVWYFAIRGKSSTKWLFALRFSLWSAVIGSFYIGGGLSRVILGLPDSRLSMSLSARLAGALGLWIITFPILFPIGVWIGARKIRKR